MALAGRTSRRGGGRRWIVLGVVLTLVVIMIDASIKSRSPDPISRMDGQVWTDRAYQIVGQANVAGDDLAALLSPAQSVSAATIDGDLTGLSAAASGAWHAFRVLRPPAGLQTASGLLETCLLVRSEAATSIARSVRAELSAPISSSAASRTAAVVAADVQKLQVADQAYRLFAAAVPASLGAPAPASRWVRSAEEQPAVQLAVLLASLRSRVSLRPLHAVVVEAISTNPSALATLRSGTQILTASSDLGVTVVVGNTGNQVEGGISVSVAIDHSTGTASGSAAVGTLDPGVSQAVTIANLNPAHGIKVTLQITVSPGPGSGIAATTRTLSFEMPLPTSSRQTPPPGRSKSTTTSTSTSTSTSTTTSSTVPSSGSSGAGTSGSSGAG